MKPSQTHRSNQASGKIAEHLQAYALAAAAAGVSVLAMAPPSRAEGVYTQADINLHDGNLFMDLNCGPNIQFWLADQLSTFATRSAYTRIRRLAINGSLNASVIVDDHGPAQLPSNTLIGPGGQFKNVHHYRQLLADVFWQNFVSVTASDTGVDGNWANRKSAFLGLRFSIHGETHYGWALVQVKPSVEYRGGGHPLLNGALFAYAYESTPDAPIVTHKPAAGMTSESASPQPGTLGALAMGATASGHCPEIESQGFEPGPRRQH
jgi:hypothetical protein